jgi:hypothetical protein
MRIFIETVESENIRNKDVGDWYESDNGIKIIKVLGGIPEDYSFLIALHEMLEQKYCEKAGIKEEDVTKFDAIYNTGFGSMEAGDSPKAPYHKQHQMATVIEKLVCNALRINWNTYSEFFIKGQKSKLTKNIMPTKKIRKVAAKGGKMVKGAKKIVKKGGKMMK